MKRVKEILDFIVSLSNAWKVVLPLGLLVLTAIVTALRFGRTTVTFSLPLWVAVIIGVLASYPIAKLAEYALKRRSSPPFKLYGLLWKKPFLPFRYPVPLCPHSGCGCEAICKRIPPPPVQLVSGVSDLTNVNLEYRYIYECPIHGKINDVPNEDVSLLRHKAKLAMKK